tara:strand:- start:377 stop:991 length:615 start_codon:yes stop_codon:yes gene_type:complete
MNFGTLKSHFNDLLNRSDITTTLTGRFIDQGIARIQRQLRTPMNEKVRNYTVTSSTASITVPNDYLELISLYFQDRELRRLPMSRMRPLVNNAHDGSPQYFTRQQADLLLHPKPTSGTLTLIYYGEFDTMSADSDENILAKAAPDLILYSALTFAADYYLDTRADVFEGKFNQFLTEVQEQANDQELNGGTNAITFAYDINGGE